MFFEIIEGATCHRCGCPATVDLLDLAYGSAVRLIQYISCIPCLLMIQSRVFQYFFLRVLLNSLFNTFTHEVSVSSGRGEIDRVIIVVAELGGFIEKVEIVVVFHDATRSETRTGRVVHQVCIF
jgi:hypothetical protein